ncbi:MAG: histidine phosphatase family protein [Pirellulales bacterium]|nr:histidine phosphatase family protein [Pirellulales bacterium]
MDANSVFQRFLDSFRPMQLYLIRHGESTYNVEGRIQGQSDPGLSELGRRQAQAIARRLAKSPIGVIFASPLRRATETAEFLAGALNLDIQFDPRLKEIDAGEFQDLLRADVRHRFPDAVGRWRSGELDFAFPGGESRRQLIARGREALLSVSHAGHDHAAIVSHGGLLLAAMKAVLGIASDAPPLGMENASITRLAVDGDDRVELVEFNSVEHLAGIESPKDC